MVPAPERERCHLGYVMSWLGNKHLDTKVITKKMNHEVNHCPNAREMLGNHVLLWGHPYDWNILECNKKRSHRLNHYHSKTERNLRLQ